MAAATPAATTLGPASAGKRQRGSRGGKDAKAKANSAPQQAAQAPATAPVQAQRAAGCFSLQPKTLTCMVSRDGKPNGVVQAWDSLGLPNRPCGWTLFKAGCKPKPGQTCAKSHDPAHRPAAEVAKIKAACDDDMLKLMH